jgi:hypothetical protein
LERAILFLGGGYNEGVTYFNMWLKWSRGENAHMMFYYSDIDPLRMLPKSLFRVPITYKAARNSVELAIVSCDCVSWIVSKFPFLKNVLLVSFDSIPSIKPSDYINITSDWKSQWMVYETFHLSSIDISQRHSTQWMLVGEHHLRLSSTNRFRILLRKLGRLFASDFAHGIPPDSWFAQSVFHHIDGDSFPDFWKQGSVMGALFRKGSVSTAGVYHSPHKFNDLSTTELLSESSEVKSQHFTTSLCLLMSTSLWRSSFAFRKLGRRVRFGVADVTWTNKV